MQFRREQNSVAEQKTGILLCGHGSRDADAVAQFTALAGQLKRRFSDIPVTHGFLEFATPVIGDGLDTLRAAGVTVVDDPTSIGEAVASLL